MNFDIQPEKNQSPCSSPIPEFVHIEAGEFLMGSTDADIDVLIGMEAIGEWAKNWKGLYLFTREIPQKTVYIDAFEIGRYPVKNCEYQVFVKEEKHRAPQYWSGTEFPPQLAQHPVTEVNWDDATEYCEWLTKKKRNSNQISEAQFIRLPTEAEWEKAARGSDGRFWPWGSIWDSAKCNTEESNLGTTSPVGKYSPAGDSPYGVADMAGNVVEWCADWFGEKYWATGNDTRNPFTKFYGEYRRTVRGGAFYYHQGLARSAYRNGEHQSTKYDVLGFRVALSKLIIDSKNFGK
jgi:formylglycine-generating enzyme required for sulfatase activity